MATFIVTSASLKPELEAAIQREFPNNYNKWNNTTWIVKSTGTAKEISDKIGIKKGSNFRGTMVVKITSNYYGLSNSEFWEWLANSFETDNG